MTQGQAEAEMRGMVRDSRIMPVQREAIEMTLAELARSRGPRTGVTEAPTREETPTPAGPAIMLRLLEERVSRLERMHAGIGYDQRSAMLRDALGRPREDVTPDPPPADVRKAAELLLGVAWNMAEQRCRAGDVLGFTAWARVWVGLLLVRDYGPGVRNLDDDHEAERRSYYLGIASAPIGLPGDPDPPEGGDALLTMMYG